MDFPQLGEARESWCAVELNKYQSWCRKEREHFKVQQNWSATNIL